MFIGRPRSNSSEFNIYIGSQVHVQTDGDLAPGYPYPALVDVWITDSCFILTLLIQIYLSPDGLFAANLVSNCTEGGSIGM